MLLLALGRHVVDDSARAGERKIFQFVESHPCASLCERTPDNPEGKDEARAAFNCGLPGFSRLWWSDDDHAAESWLHHLPVMQDHPDERLDPRDGCPGAWYRSRFAESLRRYFRHRAMDSPLRDHNPLLGPHTPALILDALRLYESYEDRAYGQMAQARAS